MSLMYLKRKWKLQCIFVRCVSLCVWVPEASANKFGFLGSKRVLETLDAFVMITNIQVGHI